MQDKEYEEINNALNTAEKEERETKAEEGINEIQKIYKSITGENITAFSDSDDLKDAAVAYATADVNRNDGLTEHRARVITRKLMKVQKQFFSVQRILAQSDKKKGSGLAIMNTVPKALSPKQVIDIIKSAEYVRVTTLNGMKVENAGEMDRIIVMYKRGDGIWDGTQDTLKRLISWIAPHDSDKKFESEVLRQIVTLVEGIYMCSDPDKIPMKNGIVNYKTKELIPYSPEGDAFCWKRPIDFKPCMEKPLIPMENGEMFDVEEFMQTLMPKEENRRLLWRIIGANIRPLVNWNRAVFFYNVSGNNGKGTILAILRSLIGEGHYLSVSPADFGKEFYLSELATGRISNILTDEINVSEFAHDLRNFKSCVTGDVIVVNRKNKDVKNVVFNGFSCFCINAPLKTADTTDSFYRRCMFLPFSAQFRDGNTQLKDGEIRENKAIKNDYLKRPEVLEWICKHVLCDMSDYYELTDTEDTLDAMKEMQNEADPIRRFLEEFPLESFTWSYIPWGFVYALYKAWFKKTMPFSTHEKGEKAFSEKYRSLIEDDPRVHIKKRKGSNYEDPRKFSKVLAAMMNDYEPYITMYNLFDWRNVTSKYKPTQRVPGFTLDHTLDSQMMPYESDVEDTIGASNNIISYPQYYDTQCPQYYDTRYNAFGEY